MKQYFYMSIKEPGKLIEQVVVETSGRSIKVIPQHQGIVICIGGHESVKEYPHFFGLLAEGHERELEDFRESFADYFMSKVLKELREDEKIICLNTCHKFALNGFYTYVLDTEGKKLVDSLTASNEAKDLKE